MFPTPTTQTTLTLITLITITLTTHQTLKLVRSESPEEQARAQKIITGCIIAGILMAIAKPLAYWTTGYDQTTPTNLPPELITATNNLLDLLMYLGVIIVIAGIIYASIQLTTTPPTQKNQTNTQKCTSTT